ncbi:hypothetical protein [Acuticoccus sediminis]|uniref:hypothetical protein n=1 Tax=Acuticoccus sediminis TaxID=2184697 RepID=UPI001CFE4E1C|nr:hypothetical protein [Acuticoccus sediminis]
MTQQSDKPAGATRRDALKLVGLGAPAVAAATVTGAAPAEATTETPETTGLRKTAHVSKYLETARF